MERYVNKGSPSGFTLNNPVSKEYRPVDGLSHFNLPLKNLRKEEGVMLISPTSINIEELFTNGGYLLPVHPDVLKAMGSQEKIEKRIKVQPTSSTRTVLAFEETHPYFVKLHYHKTIGRAPREIGLDRAINCHTFTLELNALESKIKKKIPYFSYLAEPIAIVDSKSNIGAILRETKPRPYSQEDRIIIPVFSLFSKDKYAPSDPLLLTQLLDKDTNDFFESLIRPIILTYLNLALDHGIVNEWQAQNLLIEVDHDGTIRRAVSRDFIDSYIDWDIRKERGEKILEGVHILSKHKHGEEIYYGKHSYLFDFKFGEYVLLPLCESYAEYSGDPIEKVVSNVKNIFWEIINDQGYLKEVYEYFRPFDRMYYFPKVFKTYEKGKPKFLNDRKPLFR